jgi:CRP/FNR family transcriptional regulator
MPRSCHGCPILDHSEWQALSEDEISFLDAHKTCMRLERGEVIFNEGDVCTGVYCILSGLVGIRKMDSEGNSILLGRIGYSGSKLGYRPFLAGERHRATAETLEPSTLCFIEGAAVRRLLERNSQLSLNFLESTTRALGYAEEDYFQNATHSLRTQLIRQLLVFKGRYGKKSADGTIRLDLPISRGDMAAMFGVRPESLSRAIRELRDDGLVRFSGRTAHILDVEELFDGMGSEMHS